MAYSIIVKIYLKSGYKFDFEFYIFDFEFHIFDLYFALTFVFCNSISKIFTPDFLIKTHFSLDFYTYTYACLVFINLIYGNFFANKKLDSLLQIEQDIFKIELAATF